MPRPAIRVDGLTLAEIAARAGLCVETIRARYNAGARTPDTLAAPAGKRGPKPRMIDGATVAEHVARSGVPRNRLYSRLAAGIPIGEAIDPAYRQRHHQPDALDEAIWCERLGPDGPTTTQADLARRFDRSRAAVSLREIAMRRGAD